MWIVFPSAYVHTRNMQMTIPVLINMLTVSLIMEMQTLLQFLSLRFQQLFGARGSHDDGCFCCCSWFCCASRNTDQFYSRLSTFYTMFMMIAPEDGQANGEHERVGNPSREQKDITSREVISLMKRRWLHRRTH